MSEDRLTELYRKYGPVIYARCRKLLRDDSLAEDATQETFMRVYRHLDKAPDAEQALSWIYRVATNYCLNLIRNQKRAAEPVAELPEQAGVNMQELFADKDLARRLIDRAPEKLKSVAYLHLVDGMEQVEVAKVLDISRRTVINRLQEFERNAHKFAKRSEV